MNKLLLGASALALSAGFSGAAQAEFSLTILHINDFHSRFESITGSDSTCNAEGEQKGECFGGIARLKTAIDAERQKAKAAGENVVLFSAGDEFQGSLFYTQYKSEIVADFMNQIGFDAVATGNHEFDDGPSEFAKFIAAAKFPIIGGNFDTTKDADLKGLPPGVVVLNIGGDKVGVIGATTEDTPEIASPGPNVAFESVTEYVKGAVGGLEAAGIDKIIVLSHIGYTVDQDLAKAVSGIDLIVGGHSHTFLGDVPGSAGPYPTLVKNPDGVDVPIVTAGQYGKVLGELKVTWDDAGKLVSATGAPILLDKSVKPDQGFIDKVAELGKPLETLKAEVIGTATAAIQGDRNVCRVMECSMGNLVADAQLDRVKDQGITISIANSGGLRASIDEGQITMGEVLTVLPFSNTLATFQIGGADLVASLENGVSQIEDVAGRFPQVAGLKYTFDKSKPVGSRISDVLVKDGDSWVPIDPAKTYGVVTNNYVRGGGDGYELFAKNAVNAYDFGPPLEKVVADFIAKQGGSYTPYTDGRITDASPIEAPAAEAPAAAPAAPATTEAPAAAPTTETPAIAPATEAPAMAPATDAPAMAPTPDAMAPMAPAPDAMAPMAPATEAPKQ
ncbi:MAG: 5'-nucleotidase C-terminal domain-containing protein [Devosia sp.]|uniref:bifunctional metallophosphatase/5'-nucleotidase n=1 Tax=Devosia sp. TaxID=1871048 RepID=UPI001AC5A304|nr:5'-nucleotidase C-terminal domain-containing protein [Devosia sp.]MBN9315564.1 5'-nucleotidase C-terminal domain-containing protein [Devosia sp.]